MNWTNKVLIRKVSFITMLPVPFLFPSLDEEFKNNNNSIVTIFKEVQAHPIGWLFDDFCTLEEPSVEWMVHRWKWEWSQQINILGVQFLLYSYHQELRASKPPMAREPDSTTCSIHKLGIKMRQPLGICISTECINMIQVCQPTLFDYPSKAAKPTGIYMALVQREPLSISPPAQKPASSNACSNQKGCTKLNSERGT